MNATLVDFVSERRRKKVKIAPRKNIEKGRKGEVQEDAAAEEISPPLSAAEDQKVFDVSPGITVSLFDYSIDNHFRAIDTICRLSREPRSEDIEQTEIERMSSLVTFLREWRHFNYQPRVLRFACQNENSPHGKNVSGEITLPQFSAATVPKNNEEDGNPISFDSRKDFVMNVGGLVWALDWCPGVHQKFDSHIKCEFIAVGAHPSESFYHKIGGPLVGRGLIQIWCLLNSSDKEEEASQEKEKPKKKTSNKSMMKVKSSQANRPRGRPRKNPTNISVDNSNDNNPYVQALAVQFPENSSNLHLMDMVSRDSDKHAKRLSSRKNKGRHPGVDADNLMLTSPPSYGENLPLLSQNESVACCQENLGTCSNSEPELEGCSMSILKSCNSESRAPTNVVPKDVALPRVVLCLAHNGKVAWDVKWQPSNGYDKEAKHKIGHLAVLLGNGALEVWEVPSPQTVKAIYSEHRKDGTDPRFVKLEPMFRCSKLKFGDRQSIPLTLEWSASAPHDLILAGCHDGVVALWKFSANCTSEDTRPLLCFSADTVPIRALAWAPIESDPESANVVVTAGHKGLKFWDIRDPFRPLWDLNPVQRNIYSLDWLPDPGCVIVSFDNGTLRILSLMKAAYDVPVTGKPFVGTQQQGFHSYFCSSFAIWSVQVSRLTGMVAYCSADGAVLHFQLTHRAVEKDPLRNRAPHFLCGSLSEEESAFTVINPQPNTPFPMKKSLNEWASAPRTIRGFLCVSNQAKRAKEQTEKGETSDDQTPSLCYGDDPRTESESEDLMVSQKNRPITKPKANSKRKGKSELALACRDEESDHVERGDDGKGEVRDEKIEKFPPKMVAMHSVRWNMNKGSERWLCYGGAAGIVRCQEIERA